MRGVRGIVPSSGRAESTAAELHRMLRERGQTIAVAESLTGGLLSAALTETPGASATFRGGMVSYATDLKASWVGVPEELLKVHGAVHDSVAEALAAGVRERAGSTFGLAVTGVAGPDEQDGRPVGTVYAALACADGVRSDAVRLRGNREEIRAGAVATSLELAYSIIGSR